MGVVQELKRGDPCPADGGELRPAPVPTDEQFKKAFDRENPVPLAPSMDTANPQQRAELGELHRCVTCRYQTRFPVEAAEETKPAKGKAK